jgi:tRNA pseudouridine13 synthase
MRRRCEGLPVVQGLTKAVPEDFVVDELPRYPLSGEGEHLFLKVEKRGRNTQDVVVELARQLGLRPGEVGVAGQKDRQAVTRQWLSVPFRELTALPEGEGWRVLETGRHGNKLKTGHLSGNRFTVRLRGAAGGLDAARAILTRLGEAGLPNYFGPQRFGRRGDNADQGRAILAGKLEVRSRYHRRLYLSALQSELFNEWLDRRLDDGLLDAAVEGDLLQVRASGGIFRCDDPATDGPRVLAGELDPTGPLFGHKGRRAEGPAGEREEAVLVHAGLTQESFRAGGRDARGDRRAARVQVSDPTAVPEGDDLVVAFSLPPGAYATVVLAELSGTG